ncbi:MAG: hypothetical protein ACJ72P_11730 [Nocardioides sp.]
MSTVPAGDAGEVARLRAEVARLERELHATTSPSSTPHGGGWWRVPIIAVCLVLVGVLAPLSILATWAHDEVSDTDRYVETVAPLADSPEVQAAVTARLTARIVGLIDVQAVTKDAIDALQQRGLPPRAVASLTALTPPLAAGVESFVNNQVSRLVASQAFADAWEQANRVAHTQMVAVLTGETGEAVSVTGGTVQLNLAPVIDAVKQRLVDAGFTLASRIPAVTTEITLFQSADLAKAQTAFRLLDAAARALPIIALILLGAAVAVSRRRRRTLTIGAIVIAGSMLLLGAALNFFRIAYLDAIPSDRLPADAAAVIFDQLVQFIRLNLRAVLVISLAVAFVAWVSGSQGAPVRVREGAGRALDAVRHRRDSAGLGTGPVGAFLYSYHVPLRVVVLGGAVLVYVLADHPTGAWTLGVVVVAGLILLVIELLTGGPSAPDDVPDLPAASAGHPA